MLTDYEDALSDVFQVRSPMTGPASVLKVRSRLRLFADGTRATGRYRPHTCRASTRLIAGGLVQLRPDRLRRLPACQRRRHLPVRISATRLTQEFVASPEPAALFELRSWRRGPRTNSTHYAGIERSRFEMRRCQASMNFRLHRQRSKTETMIDQKHVTAKY